MFSTLDQCRSAGAYGPNPIGYSDIVRFLDEHEIVDAEVRRDTTHLVMAMDQLALSHAREKISRMNKGK